MIAYVSFVVQVSAAALNLGLYVDSHRWFSLSAAAFCSAVAAWTLVMEGVERR